MRRDINHNHRYQRRYEKRILIPFITHQIHFLIIFPASSHHRFQKKLALFIFFAAPLYDREPFALSRIHGSELLRPDIDLNFRRVPEHVDPDDRIGPG